MKFLVVFIILLHIFEIVSQNTFKLRIRNSLLRIYIACDKKYIINECKNKLIDKIISKYNDINLLYNTLTEEEKEFIQAIISLCY